MSALEIARAAMEQATSWPDIDLSLIRDDRGGPPAFDWDAVPLAWRHYVTDTVADCGTPPDYTFAGLLAVASAALGNARRVSPWGGWIEQPHLWFCLVGNPSAGKTPALKPFRDAARALERAEEPGYDAELAAHERDAAEAAAVMERWKTEVKEAVKAGESPPDQPARAVAPDPPKPPRLVATNATTEALGACLQNARDRQKLQFNDNSGDILD